MSATASNGAVLSGCGRYRYALTRGDWLDGEGTCMFVMLNPSTADAREDDPTIRRCVGFARSWGFARLVVANLYAFRATDPRGLWAAEDPVGPDNDRWLWDLSYGAHEVIAAWGATRHPGGADRVRAVLEALGSPHDSTRCLGQTMALHPRHPLYVRRDARRIPFMRRAA